MLAAVADGIPGDDHLLEHEEVGEGRQDEQRHVADTGDEGGAARRRGAAIGPRRIGVDGHGGRMWCGSWGVQCGGHGLLLGTVV